MTSLSRLYQIAEEENIEVDCFDLRKREALSMMDDDGCCSIAVNPYKLRSERDERMKLAHELGHCITGSFYNAYATADCRQRHENQADKWAIQKLVPSDELKDAVSLGYSEPWELADYFEVTEDFIKKAVCYYTNGNVAAELYF